MDNTLSVILCTYNGSQRLPNTLRSLSLQEPHYCCAYEIVVVDNASNDNSSEIALSSWKYYGEPFPIRLLFEHKPGLSFARKCGVLHTKSTFIVFCDDDNLLKSDYLSRTVDHFL